MSSKSICKKGYKQFFKDDRYGPTKFFFKNKDTQLAFFDFLDTHGWDYDSSSPFIDITMENFKVEVDRLEPSRFRCKVDWEGLLEIVKEWCEEIVREEVALKGLQPYPFLKEFKDVMKLVGPPEWYKYEDAVEYSIAILITILDE